MNIGISNRLRLYVERKRTTPDLIIDVTIGISGLIVQGELSTHEENQNALLKKLANSGDPLDVVASIENATPNPPEKTQSLVTFFSQFPDATTDEAFILKDAFYVPPIGARQRVGWMMVRLSAVDWMRISPADEGV